MGSLRLGLAVQKGAKWFVARSVRWAPMSALVISGHLQCKWYVRFTPNRTFERLAHVRFVPIADIAAPGRRAALARANNA